MKVQPLVLFSSIVCLILLSCDTTPTGQQKEEKKTGTISGKMVMDYYDNFSSYQSGVPDIWVTYGNKTYPSGNLFEPEYKSIQSIKTDLNGNFIFNDIPVGTYSVWYEDLFYNNHYFDDIEVKQYATYPIPDIYIKGRYIILYGNISGVEPDTIRWSAYWNSFYNHSEREYFAGTHSLVLYRSTPYQLKYLFDSYDWINDNLLIRTMGITATHSYDWKYIKIILHNNKKSIYNLNFNLNSIPVNSNTNPYIIDLY